MLKARLFALGASRPLGEKSAALLGWTLSAHEERRFEDGEHKFRPIDPVRGADIFVIHSLFADAAATANDKLCELLFFLGAVRDAGAARVTAIAPYLAYGRKDRRTNPQDPLTARYVAQLLEAMAVDAVVTIDAHNLSAFENAFRRPILHLEARVQMAERLATKLGAAPVVVASPDPGGVKRAQLFRETLEKTLGRAVEFALLEKRRAGGVVSGDLMAGNVGGADVLIVDDLISTGGTMAHAARAFRGAGANRVFSVATHGLFVGDACAALADSAIEKTFITDTITPDRLSDAVIKGRLEIVGAAPLIAGAIRALCCDEQCR